MKKIRIIKIIGVFLAIVASVVSLCFRNKQDVHAVKVQKYFNIVNANRINQFSGSSSAYCLVSNSPSFTSASITIN